MAFIQPAAVPLLAARPFLNGTATSPRRVHALRTRRVTMATPPSPPDPSPATVVPSTSPATSPAATPTKPFNWLDQWYPVAWAEDVPELRPIPFTIWQRNYVLFRDRPTGLFVAMDDVCPHRAAPLSEGRLYERDGAEGNKETILECGYHGWRFNCDGRCVDIPVVPLERRIPAAADVGGVYATSVSLGGLVFVWLGDRAKADESKIPVPKEILDLEKQGRLTLYRNTRRMFPMDYTTVLENAVDPAHVQWAHHGSGIGKREWVPRNGSLEVLDKAEDEGYFLGGIRIGDSPTHRLLVSFIAPTFVSYEILSSNLGSFHLPVWIVPVDRSRCMVFSANVKVDLDLRPRLLQRLRPRWYEHTLSNIILDGDCVLLQWQESYLQAQQRDGYGGAWKRAYLFASGAWDSMVVEVRRWLDDRVGTMPYAKPFSPDVAVKNESRRELNDRFLHHVQDCASCSPALRNMRMGRIAAFVGAAVGAAATVLSGIVGAALSGGGVPFAMRPLQIAGIVGAVACGTLFLVARVLGHFVELMTYTEIAYEANHGD